MKFIYNKLANFLNPSNILRLSICIFAIINLNACENQTGATTQNQTINTSPKPSKSKELASQSNLALGFSKLAVGYFNTCGIINDNTAYCWGYNAYGQLGNGSTNKSSVPVPITIGGNSAIPSGNTISEISSGFFTNCAIDNTGKAYCWGYNGYGELGNGTNVNSSVPVAVTFGSNSITQISSGVLTNCAIDNTGKAYCWGYNGYGELGNGTTRDSFVPVAVAIGGNSAIPSGSTILQISAGEYNTCAIASDHKAYCWGANWYGQLGDGTTNSSIYPVAVTIGGNSAIPSGSTILQISTNEYSTCAIASNNNAYCWGYNGYGQLGNGTTNSSAYPVGVTTGGSSAIPSGNTIIQISNSGMYNCAVDNDNTAYCWGSNQYGQLGNGTTNSSSVPVAVTIGSNSAIPNGSNIAQIFGFYNTCAISTDNNIYCWGENAYGELGNGSTNSSSLPTHVLIWNNIVYNTTGYTDLNSVALSLAFMDNTLLLGNSNTPGVPGFRNIWQLNSNTWTNISTNWSNYRNNAPTALLPLSESEIIVGQFNGSVQDCSTTSCSYLVPSQGSLAIGVTSLLQINNNYFIAYSDATTGNNGQLLVYPATNPSGQFKVSGINSGVGKITTDNNYIYAPTRNNGVLKISLDGINSVNITPTILQNTEFVTILYYANNTLYAGTSLANVYKASLPITDGNNWKQLNSNSLSDHGYISGIAVDSLNNLYAGIANLFTPIDNGSLYILNNGANSFISAPGYSDSSSITSLLFNNNHIFAATFAGNIWQN